MSEKQLGKVEEKLDCKKKYLYEYSMFWECDDGSKCQILEDDVCDLLNRLSKENKQLKEENIKLKKLRKYCAEWIGVKEENLYDVVR